MKSILTSPYLLTIYKPLNASASAKCGKSMKIPRVTAATILNLSKSIQNTTANGKIPKKEIY